MRQFPAALRVPRATSAPTTTVMTMARTSILWPIWAVPAAHHQISAGRARGRLALTKDTALGVQLQEPSGELLLELDEVVMQ